MLLCLLWGKIYIALELLQRLFDVSALIGKSIIARGSLSLLQGRDCWLQISQDLVELEMIYFILIIGRD